MKFYINMLLIGLFFISCACNKEEDQNGNMNPGNNNQGMISATVDGSSWESQFIDLALWAGSQLQLRGERNDGSLIQISILGIDSAGTYFVGGANLNIATYNASNGDMWGTNILSPVGTVVVSQLNSSGTEGTFEFTGTDGNGNSVQVTQGEFDVNF